MPRSPTSGHGAEFGPEVAGFTVDGTAGLRPPPGDRPRTRTAATTRSPSSRTVFINLVPDHVIFHRMYPMAADRTVVECDWLYTAEVVAAGTDVSRSVELFHRVNEQDFEACERTQPAMSSRAYRHGGVLVPANTTSRSSTTGSWASWARSSPHLGTDRTLPAPSSSGGPGAVSVLPYGVSHGLDPDLTVAEHERVDPSSTWRSALRAFHSR